MKKSKNWAIIGFFFISIVGTLLHFVYDWSGDNPVVGAFAPINESVWEHLKLIFLPALLFYIVEFIFGKRRNLVPAKAISLFLGPLFIVAGYYTYTGITGERALWADLLIFFIAVLVMQFQAFKIQTRKKEVPPGYSLIGILLVLILAAAFVVATFVPPNIPLFKSITIL